MKQFSVQIEVISKKKVFTQIQSVFLTNFRWCQRQKLQFPGPNPPSPPLATLLVLHLLEIDAICYRSTKYVSKLAKNFLDEPLKKTVTVQTRRHGGAYRGRAPQLTACAPPKRKLCPPKRGLCPKEINRLGASGAQIEVQISVFWGLTPDFVTFLGWRPFFLFLRSPVFGRKNAWISDFGRKIPFNYCFWPCLFDPDWDKLLMPPCPSRIHAK